MLVLIHIEAFVSGGMYEQYAFGFGQFNGFVHGGFAGGECFAEAHVEDFGAIVYGVFNGVGYVFVVFIAIGYGAHNHQLYVVGNAVDTDAIATGCGYDAGYVCAVVAAGADDIVVAVVAVAGVAQVVADDVGAAADQAS